MADVNEKQAPMGTPEELHQFAVALDQFAEDYDTYEYRDVVEDKEEHIRSLETQLLDQKTDSIRGYLLDFIKDERNPDAFSAAQILLEQMDSLVPPVPGTVLNLCGSMGSDYNMIRITNMEPEQVKAVLEEMIATVPEEQIDNVEAYLEQAGGHIEQIGGSYNDFSPHFPVMLEYDFDTNKVYTYDKEPEQGTFTIYQLKSGEELHYHRFEPLERLERFGLFVDPDNYEKVYTGALPEDGSTMMKLESIYETFNLHHPEDFKGHSLSVSDIVVLHEAGRDTAHYMDSIGFEEVPAFFKQEPDRFRYYITEEATRHGTYPYMDETDQTRFTSQLHKYEQGAITAYGYLEYSKPLTPEQEKAYALIPSPQNHLETVEKTEEQNFNHIDGILNNLPTEEAAVSIDGGSLYLAVQTCDSGYDYTFFNGAFEELDGGQLDNPELSMAQAVYELISDEGWEQAKLEAIDYDFLMEQAEAAERDRHIRMQAMAYVQDVLSDADLGDEVIITGAKVYISPYADPAKPDYDVLLEYEGDIREDEFFNLLHEQTFMIDGKPVDFNPITPAKSGTIQEYLAMLEQQAAQEPAPAQAEVLRVVPIGRFERYIEPSEVTQDQYIVKGGILLSPCASNPDFYESTNRALNGTYIDAQIYEVAERSKKGKPTAFRKTVDAPVENPLEPVGKEIGIIKAGGIPCGLVYKHEMEGFELQDHTILLQKERDAHGNYYSGLSLDGMMVKTPQMYAPVVNEQGEITAFRRMREKDFSRQKPKETEKKPSIREQLAKNQPVKSPVKPSAKHKETER
ncbi:MAG: YodL domain-containing protein [Eubacteriales bacterium]|nr:YodL domain-containing protein [Eubacteriales bacterium]